MGPLEQPKGASTMKITTVGIDLAKNVFQVHGIDEHGKVIKKQLKRDQMAAVLRQPAAVPGRDGGLRQRAPLGAQAAGHGSHGALMAPQFVKPYVKTNKNDAADAEAICEAVSSTEHALCSDQERRATRHSGAAPGAAGVCQGTHGPGQSDPGPFGRVWGDRPARHHHIAIESARIDRRCQQRAARRAFRCLISACSTTSRSWTPGQELERKSSNGTANSDEASQNRLEIPGIGPITASALVASLGDAKNFEDGRQVAAWLGLVPRQHSSGGKSKPAGHQQAWGYLSANLADSRCASVIYHAEARDPSQQLGQQVVSPAQQEHGGCGLGQQECADRLGVAGA
jgi:transposase